MPCARARALHARSGRPERPTERIASPAPFTSALPCAALTCARPRSAARAPIDAAARNGRHGRIPTRLSRCARDTCALVRGDRRRGVPDRRVRTCRACAPQGTCLPHSRSSAIGVRLKRWSFPTLTLTQNRRVERARRGRSAGAGIECGALSLPSVRCAPGGHQCDMYATEGLASGGVLAGKRRRPGPR